MKRAAAAWLAGTLIFVVSAGARAAETIVVASKSFTESVILGEIATHLLRDADSLQVKWIYSSVGI